MANVAASWLSSSSCVGVAVEVKAAGPPPAGGVNASWLTSASCVGVALEIQAASGAAAPVAASWASTADAVGVAVEIKQGLPPASGLNASWATSSSAVGVGVEIKVGASSPQPGVSASWVTSSAAVAVAVEVKGISAPPPPPTPPLEILEGPALSAIREGIATNLRSRMPDGVQISAYMLSSPTPPALYVLPDEIEYDIANARGADLWTLRIVGIVGTSSDQGSQIRLDRWMSPSGQESVKAAIQLDETLGNTRGIDDVRVTRCTGYRIVQQEGAGAVLAVEWIVEVIASGVVGA